MREVRRAVRQREPDDSDAQTLRIPARPGRQAGCRSSPRPRVNRAPSARVQPAVQQCDVSASPQQAASGDGPAPGPASWLAGIGAWPPLVPGWTPTAWAWTDLCLLRGHPGRAGRAVSGLGPV